MATDNRNSAFREQYNMAQTSKDSLGVKAVFSAFSALSVTVLSFFHLSSFIYGIVCGVLCVIVYLICRHELNDGLVSVFRLRPSNDSLNVIALIFGFVHSVYMVLVDFETPRLFCPAVFFSIFISMAMKYVYVRQIIANMDFINSNKTYAVNIEHAGFTKRYVDRMCVVRQLREFPDVFNATCERDPSEAMDRLFVPILFGCIIVASGVIGFFKGLAFFVTSLAALSAVAASFTEEMSFVFPYIVSQIELRKNGSLLLGYNSVETLRDINTIVVRDLDLFPSKLAVLESFRFRSQQYMEESVEYAAAVLKATKSPLSKLFNEVMDFPEDRICEVEDWKYMKNYGVTAHINGNSVVLGNRSMLLSYSIQPLPQETEASLVSQGRNILYLGINGILCSYMVVNYNPDPEMRRAAAAVGSGGDFTIVIETKDCNITESMIQKKYSLQNMKIIVLDADETSGLSAIRKRLRKENPSPVMISNKNAIGILSSIRKAKNLCMSIGISIRTKQISTAIGVIMTIAAFFIAPFLVSGWWVFIYNLIWSVPIMFIAFMK